MSLIQRVVFTVVAVSFAAPTLRADSFSFSGNFKVDNDEAVFTFTTTGQGIFSVQTFSYGGGTDYNGNAVTAGGFAPAISIFDSTGLLQAVDYTGGTVGASDPNFGCQGRSIDGTTGFCEDAAVYGTAADHLNPGTYTLVLTQSQNEANDAFLADGFTYDTASCPYSDGCSAYTGESSGLPGQMFIDPGDHTTQRTNYYEISFSGADLTAATESGSVSPVPEPATLPLVLTGVLGLGVFVKNRLLQPV